MRTAGIRVAASIVAAVTLAACGDNTPACEGIVADTPFVTHLGCEADFLAIASRPLDATIPGARSVKTTIDRADDDALYFPNPSVYPLHYGFIADNLSGDGLPLVPSLTDFNATEYTAPDRRFVLGAFTYYEQPEVWVYEIAPYDTADAAMIAFAYRRIAGATFVGSRLYFHPTSEAVAAAAAALPASVPVITTEELYAGIDYQPLNVAESFGQLRFVSADQLGTGQAYLSFRDIAVLDRVPNDISVALGIITSEFQTPLSHVNVLSKNRGTPNMGLRDAFTRADLRALEGRWVRLAVGPYDYQLVEVSKGDADAWWDSHRPSAVQVPGIDLSVTDLRDDVAILAPVSVLPVKEAVSAATRAFGGKAAHFGALTRVPDVTIPRGFAIPVYYYRQFVVQHGFDTRVTAMLADPAFQDSPAERDRQLALLRADMMVAAVDPTLLQAVGAKIVDEFTYTRMRFRSSTNAEDLDGFTGAGLYTSVSGDPNDPDLPIEDAIREVWASVWRFKAFEERSYRGIDHLAVAMALLVHRSFPAEESNGVALTNNPFDATGLNPAFYVNAQIGGASVVLPPPGVTTDQFLVFPQQIGLPVLYIARSNLVAPGSHVLDHEQTVTLARALDRIHTYFEPAYGPTPDQPWYAMDIEWKFEGEPGQPPQLYVKQARPHGP